MSLPMLGASELILTPQGAIYHLDLPPDALADTVITVGDPARVAAVSRHFDAIEHRSAHREFITHTGRIGSKRISVVSTGIGPDNIDIVLNELDALANVDFATRTVRETKKSLTIIRLGTAGGLQAGIDVDSFVASSFGIGLDNLLHYYQHEANPEERYILNDFIEHTGLKTGPVQPYIAEGAIRLRNRFTDGFTHGITVTCPGFYGPQGRVVRGPLAYPHLIDALGTFESRGERVANFEMETAALYGLGKLFGHHCLSLSVIVAQRVLKTFSKDGAAAVERLLEKALPIIASL